ncbi:MAG TPA: c(7)-type cytochrome triheme domain-containing protein, partial [Azonexus sp.]|nr:c(7)-type cytochrome triheme domain-containing protein [Azonexus sp.]
EATRHLPYDANGFPDWMKALNKGLIKPRASLNGKDKMEVIDLDIVMRNTKEMPFVKFPHRSHTEWLACSNCHPDPFPTKAGASQIRMVNIFRGQFCGKCHDRVAFVTFFSCDRCHSQPQNQPPKAPAP